MQQLYELLAHIASSHEHPLASEISSRISKGDWQGLKQLELKPGDLSPDDFWFFSQCRSLLLKVEGLPGMPSNRQLEEDCLKEFYRCEAKNYETNHRVRNLIRKTGFETPSSDRIREFLSDVRKEIKALLGVLPDIEKLSTRFGPGSTFCRPAPFNTFADKISSAPTYTIDSWPFALDWVSTAWARCVNRQSDDFYPDSPLGVGRGVSYGLIPERVRGNRYTTVPKDSFKRRGICVEPALNVFYQLGYGSWIRNRLKTRWGIDLREGQSLHRESALLGSMGLGIATLDLSSASDLISFELLKALLPRDWFHVLSSLRSPYTRVGKKWVKLEKFSSMGNGFTFELETLIFAGLVRVIARKRGFDVDRLVKDGILAQYGDDTIIPEEIVSDVIGVFKWCGFEINIKKSYHEGPFRESCGGDYHSGVDVRTFKLKELPDAPEKWISFANGLWSVCRPDRFGPQRFSRFRRLHRWVLGNLPLHLRRLRGPEHLGDQVVHTFEAEWQSNCYEAHGIKYYWGYVPIANHIPLSAYPTHAAVGAALMGFSSRGPVNPSRPVLGYKVRLIGKPRDLKVRLRK